jgi:hypothetical protein
VKSNCSEGSWAEEGMVGRGQRVVERPEEGFHSAPCMVGYGCGRGAAFSGFINLEETSDKVDRGRLEIHTRLYDRVR